MSRFLSKSYQNLVPYTPGEQPQTQRLIKLNTNENPYPPSPNIQKRLNEVEISKLMLYPDPEAMELVEAIADFYQVEKSQVFVGNGSDEILAFLFMAFQNESRKIYYPSISYGFYPVYSDVFQANACPVPLTSDLSIDPEDYKNADGTIIIANPNAPTGKALELSEIERIVKANRDNLVVIDEAYVDFGAKSCVPFTAKYDNLLVVQTLSKSRSLAGSRVGFAIGSREVIADLNTIKFSFNPYNLNRLSILAAAEAIRDREYFDMTRKKVMDTRERFTAEMEKLGFTILPSRANFVFAKSSILTGKDYFNRLRHENIIVRHFNKPLIEDYVRITIGRDEDMDELIRITEKLLQKENGK